MHRTLLFIGLILFSVSSFGQGLIVDSLFGSNGQAVFNFYNFDQLSRVVMDPSGKLVAGGYAYGSGYDIYAALSRFDICGTPDSTFSEDGLLMHSHDLRNLPYDITVQNNNRIVCAGMEASSNAGSGQIPFISRYTSAGLPDSTFNSDGFLPQRFDPISSGAFYAVHLYPDQRILCIGLSSANINGGVTGYGAIRFTPAGDLDATFDGDGIARYTVNAAGIGGVRGHLLSDGRIIPVFSIVSSYPYHFYMGASALDSTGALDGTFGSSGIFQDTVKVSGDTYTALQSDEQVVMAALAEAQHSVVVIRISPQGIIDNTFGTNGHTTFAIPGAYSAQVFGVRMLSDGRIFVMGKEGGAPFLVALNSDGSPDSDFGTGGYMTLEWSGISYLYDIFELSNGQLVAAGSNSNDFDVVRLIDESNVPHLSYNGWMLSTTGGDSFQWYLDGSPIGGATAANYDPQQDGDYYVVATDSWGCTYASDTFTVSNSAVGSVSEDASVSVFPNPFVHYFQIESKAGQIHSVVITDLAGRIVISLPVYGNSAKVEAPLSPGTYLVEINTAKGVIKRMMVKQ